MIPGREVLGSKRTQRLAFGDTWEGYEPPRQLRDLRIVGRFRKLPTWINSSLLPNLSDLDVHINSVDLGEQDVVNLGGLPNLTSIHELVWIPGGMEFTDGAFPKLSNLRVYAPFRFRQGSMQSLESICISLEVRSLKDAGTGFDFIGSLGNLHSLRRVGARMYCDDAYASDVHKVTAAVRRAINTHPNRPTLALSTYGRCLVQVTYYMFHCLFGMFVFSVPDSYQCWLLLG